MASCRSARQDPYLREGRLTGGRTDQQGDRDVPLQLLRHRARHTTNLPIIGGCGIPAAIGSAGSPGRQRHLWQGRKVTGNRRRQRLLRRASQPYRGYPGYMGYRATEGTSATTLCRSGSETLSSSGIDRAGLGLGEPGDRVRGADLRASTQANVRSAVATFVSAVACGAAWEWPGPRIRRALR